MKTRIYVVNKYFNWNFEPVYTFPYFYFTKEAAIENAKTKTIAHNNKPENWKKDSGAIKYLIADYDIPTENWRVDYGIAVFELGENNE